MILINSNSPALISAVRFVGSSPFSTRRLSQSSVSISRSKSLFLHLTETKEKGRREDGRVSIVCDAGGMFPVDPWAPTIDSQSIASQLFAVSLFPYIGFLYFLTKSKSAPKLTLFGFYFLLAFVGATIPAGIYGKFLQHYKTFSWIIDSGSRNWLMVIWGCELVMYIVGSISAKVHYGTSLSNVDWLHGGAESLLALTNLFIVLGLRQALRKSDDDDDKLGNDEEAQTSQEKEKSSV